MTFMLIAFCFGAAAAFVLPKVLYYAVHAHTYNSYVFASRARRTDPPGTPSHDPRPGFFLHARTMLYVHFRHWLPNASKPKAVVILAHGVGEHCGRFEHVAHAFMAKDFAVFALDHIGHGCERFHFCAVVLTREFTRQSQSEGDRLYVQSFNDYVDCMVPFKACTATDRALYE